MKNILLFIIVLFPVFIFGSSYTSALSLIDYAGLNNAGEQCFWGVENSTQNNVVLFSLPNGAGAINVLSRLTWPDSLAGQPIKKIVALDTETVVVMTPSSVYYSISGGPWLRNAGVVADIGKHNGMLCLLVLGCCYVSELDNSNGSQIAPDSGLTPACCFSTGEYPVAVGGTINWGDSRLAALKIYFNDPVHSPALFVSAEYNKVVNLIIDSGGNTYAAVLADEDIVGKIGVIRFDGNYQPTEIFSVPAHYPSTIKWLMIANPSAEGGVYLAGGTNLSKISPTGEETSVFVSNYGNNIRSLVSLQDGRIVILLQDRVEVLGNTLQSVNETNINTPLGLTNYPNPFNPTTTISFSLQKAENAVLEIYNIKGQKVKTLLSKKMTTGNHSVTWNGTDDSGNPVSSGVYFARFCSKGRSPSSQKMILLK